MFTIIVFQPINVFTKIQYRGIPASFSRKALIAFFDRVSHSQYFVNCLEESLVVGTITL